MALPHQPDLNFFASIFVFAFPQPYSKTGWPTLAIFARVGRAHLYAAKVLFFGF